MKYLLFDIHAVECIVEKTGFQSREFPLGKDFIDCVNGEYVGNKIDDIYIKRIGNKGIIFAGENCDKGKIIVFDLEQSGMLEKEQNADDLLIAFQKSLRTAIRIWNRYPFTFSERIHETKSIIFPFVYTDHRRMVIERSVSVERLKKRGVDWPLLAYKYGTEDAKKNEEANLSVMKEAGEAYLDNFSEIRLFFRQTDSVKQTEAKGKPLYLEQGNEVVSNKGFKYLPYKNQMEKLTSLQKDVVENLNMKSPIRIEGPAGTGKTISMILRAYKLLCDAKMEDRQFKIIFFSHSEVTNSEAQYTFSLLENAEDFLSENLQCIQFISLFQYCIQLVNVKEGDVIDQDVSDAKQYQRIFIEDALDKVMMSKYKTYRPLLSDSMKEIFDEEKMGKGVLISMLQHEFGVQIKGRTDCTLEEYCKLKPIKNALPAETQRDKEFVYTIFKEYQEMLQTSSVYDSDDITIQALSQLNAPFWRRKRSTEGYDYIFVDEMHLFNINEQHVFHYLTKNISQEDIPVCFALDYGQAIGDRGDVAQDYIERTYSDATQNQYKTVFRSSQAITDFCASISAAGALMFQADFRNSYSAPTSGFTHDEEEKCELPTLFMYANDEKMFDSIKHHVDTIKRETQCDNKEIAIVTFEEDLLDEEFVKNLSKEVCKNIFVLENRFSLRQAMETIPSDSMVLSSPQNINGLEFAGVILVGVDDGRVPQTNNVSDVSENYIKYIAFNQLYLASSRAKYMLVLLGNEIHGISPCLQYAIENYTLETKK